MIKKQTDRMVQDIIAGARAASMTVRIGEADVGIIDVRHTRTNNDGGDWLCGTATVVWDSGNTHGAVEVEIGCWSDTDDDEAEWCAANEGANAIESAIRGEDMGPYDSRGGFVREAFPGQCERLGVHICEQLRRAATAR